VFAGLRGPARTFSYLVPDELDLLPGHLVRVGLGQRAVAGVVISLDGVPARELRPVDSLVHPLPLLRAHQLALAAWIAERYRCGLADAVRAMLPPARSRAGGWPSRVDARCAGFPSSSRSPRTTACAMSPRQERRPKRSQRSSLRSAPGAASCCMA